MSRQRGQTLSEILPRMVMIKQRTLRTLRTLRTGMTNPIKIMIRQLSLMRQS